MPAARVPGSELASINRSFSGLLSFSRSFKQSSSAPRWATMWRLLLAGSLLGQTEMLKACFFAANAHRCGLGSKGCSLGTTRKSCCGRVPIPRLANWGKVVPCASRPAASALQQLGRAAWSPPGASMRPAGEPVAPWRAVQSCSKPWWHVVAGNCRCMTADLPVSVLPTCSADLKLAARSMRRLADGDGHGCAEWWHQVCAAVCRQLFDLGRPGLRSGGLFIGACFTQRSAVAPEQKLMNPL